MPLINDDAIPQVALDFMNSDHAEATAQIYALDMLLGMAAEGDQESLNKI